MIIKENIILKKIVEQLKPKDCLHGNQKALLRKVRYMLYRFLESIVSEGVLTTLQKTFYRIKHKNILIHEKYSEGKYSDPDIAYQVWRQKYSLTEEGLTFMQQKSAMFSYRPVISIAMPTYKSTIPYLKKTIQSVVNQCYPFWQLCICDDGSNNEELKQALQKYSKIDSRIVCTFSDKNEGIILASQKASSLATGEFITFIDQDDLLSRDALYRVVLKLNESPDLDILYSDNDKVDLNDLHREVYFKPDYSPDELFCHNYIGHLSVLRKRIFDEVGGFVTGYEGAQDFDLLLRAVEKTDKIFHLPYVLYSWRKTPGSTASSPMAKHYAYESGKKALQDYFKKKGFEIIVSEAGERGLYRCRFPSKSKPLVSIIIVSKDNVQIKNCVKSLFEKTDYKYLEVVVVLSSLSNSKTDSWPFKEKYKKIFYPHEFNFSKMVNFGRKNVSGDYIVLLDEKSQIIESDWIDSFLDSMQRKEVGIVGAKLLYPSQKVYHGGIILGLNGTMDYAFKGVPDDAIIYNQPHQLVRNCTAVSSECMFVRAKVFDELSGFDEKFVQSYGDADFCLRARSQGYWIVWTPFVQLYIQPSQQNGNIFFQKDEGLFKNKWEDILADPDPFYNINLTKKYFDFSPNID